MATYFALLQTVTITKNEDLHLTCTDHNIACSYACSRGKAVSTCSRGKAVSIVTKYEYMCVLNAPLSVME